MTLNVVVNKRTARYLAPNPPGRPVRARFRRGARARRRPAICYKTEMPRILLVLLTVLTPAIGGASDDEAALRALIARYVQARETQNAREVEALFTADADQLVSSGEWRRAGMSW
jgi:hypothetical protein